LVISLKAGVTSDKWTKLGVGVGYVPKVVASRSLDRLFKRGGKWFLMNSKNDSVRYEYFTKKIP